MFERLARRVADSFKKVAGVVVDAFKTTGKVLKRVVEKSVKGLGDLFKRLQEILDRALRAVLKIFRRAFGGIGSPTGLGIGAGGAALAAAMWMGGCMPAFQAGGGSGPTLERDEVMAPVLWGDGEVPDPAGTVEPPASHSDDKLPATGSDSLPLQADDSGPDQTVPIEIVPLDLHSAPVQPAPECPGSPCGPGTATCTVNLCGRSDPTDGTATESCGDVHCELCSPACDPCGGGHGCPDDSADTTGDDGFFAPDSKAFGPSSR